MRLQQRQARETGICPVRRELYSQCFGEYLVQRHYLDFKPGKVKFRDLNERFDHTLMWHC